VPDASGLNSPGWQTKRSHIHLLPQRRFTYDKIERKGGPHYRLDRRRGPRGGKAVAASPELGGESGLYFNGQREARADAQAYDADARRQLKALSVKLAGLSVNEYTSP